MQYIKNAKTIDLVLFVILLVIHLLLVFFYRPHAYANHITGIGLIIANNYPSFSAVLIGYIALKIYNSTNLNGYGYFNIDRKYILLVSIMIGNYLYEGLDILLGKGDWGDMIAITIGGITTYLFILLKFRHHESI